MNFLTRERVGALVSRVGELVHSDRLIYNRWMFANFEAVARENARPVVDALLAEFPATTTVLDVGCGTGDYVIAFTRRGCAARGVEWAPHARERAITKGAAVTAFDLNEPDIEPVAVVDLVVSIEVGEHIAPDLASTFVRFCTRRSNTIFLTSAHPGQRGQGHVNEQPQSYWIELFRNEGYVHDAAQSAQLARRMEATGVIGYLVKNAMVFRRLDS